VAEHCALWTLLDDIEASLRKRDDASVERVRVLARALALLLEHHFDTEERELIPALRAIDAWGPARVAQLVADHNAEREEAAAVRALLEVNAASSAAIARLSAAIRMLRDDIGHEERESLQPELLRDDVVVLGQTSG
jgi:hypothetical protein